MRQQRNLASFVSKVKNRFLKRQISLIIFLIEKKRNKSLIKLPSKISYLEVADSVILKNVSKIESLFLDWEISLVNEFNIVLITIGDSIGLSSKV